MSMRTPLPTMIAMSALTLAIGALSLPDTALAQTMAPGGTAGPANPPAAPGPPPPAGPAPAEIMPPTGGSSSATAAPSDAVFASTAAAAGLAEVRMGQLAEQKAQSTRVRTFATRMVTDHTRLADRLAAIAQRKGLTLPTQPNPQDASALADLSRQSGTSFDSAYMHTQVADHEVAVSAFRQEAEHGTDPDLKAFAQAALPTLQQHLRMARQTEQGS